MDTYQEIRSCTNCLHCGTDDNGKSQCGINREIHTSGCKAFAPKNAEIEEKHAKDIVRDSISTPLTYIGLAILGLAMLVCFCLEFKMAGDYALLALIATGVVCLTLATVAYCIYRSRRKDMERLVRDDVEREVRKELLPKLLTQEAIKEYLNKQNYLPRIAQSGAGWVFTMRENDYAIYYDNVNRVVVRYAIFLSPEDVSTMEHLVKCRDSKQFAIDMWIQEFTKDNGESNCGLECIAEFYVEHIDQFERFFPLYLTNVESSVYNIFYALQKCKENQQNGQNENDFRSDLYNPEYRLIPYILQAVATDHLLPDALVDEEWIRREIQNRCDNKECKEEWNSFKINRVDNYGNYKMVVYQFPEPKVVPEAKYGVVLLNTSTKEGNYYTLEMSHDDMWYYGGVADTRHLNYGIAESTDLDKFIEWVLSSSKTVVAYTDYAKRND